MSANAHRICALLIVTLTAGLAACGGSATPRPASPTPAVTAGQSAVTPAPPADLALGRTATASRSVAGQPPDNAFDDDPATLWRSGAAPEQWIQVDLGAPARITEVRLLVYQPEAGATRHRLLAGGSPDDLRLVQEFSGATTDGQELVFTPIIPLMDVRYLRILTLENPGWVAWRDIRVFGEFEAVTAQPTTPPAADVIFYNGTILTMEADQPTAEAIALRGDRILAVGNRLDVFLYQGSGTRLVDLGGLALTPGFIDSHQHRIGDRWQYSDLPPQAGQVFYEILKEGWTSIHELWVNNDRLNELVGLGNAGQLPVRVSMYLEMNSEYTLDNWWQAYQPLTRYGPYLQIAGLKITLDREWGQQIFFSNQSDLNALVLSGTSRGWQVATHVFSPPANQLILNAYASALNGGFNDTLRLRMEHLGTLTDAELQQMADLHIIGSVQLVSTGSWPDDPSFRTEIPSTLVPLTGRWRDLIDAGVYLIGNTDAPWCCTAWRQNVRGPGNAPTVPQAIYQGVTRTTFTGRPPEAWQSAQVVTVQEALEMLTIRGAYAAHQEGVTGSLKAGKYADLVILSGDPLTTPTAQLPGLQVVETMVGGQVGYCAEGYSSICAATSNP